MKKGALLLCVLLILACLTGCFGKKSKTIIGSWEHDSLGAVYEFTEDGQVIVTLVGQNPMYGTYTLENETGTVVLSVNGMDQAATYSISGQKLLLTSPDSGAQVTMTRVN
ncbi:MAG: hypothetical protein IJP30_03510 [Clostridia bacterium]|nr:hypothetical protein [Clostridia bacterium]